MVRFKPYDETDVPNPLNVYGFSKLHGEQTIQQVGGGYLILRISWVYSLRQGCFVNKVLEWAYQQETLRVVSAQDANPTWPPMLAEMTAQISARGNDRILERTGLYRLVGGGFASRLEWAKLISEFDPNKSKQKVEEILPALTSDFPSPAQRPLFSTLEFAQFAAIFGLCLPDWKKALSFAMGT